MKTVELVYFKGCPHVEEAREQLHRALSQAGIDKKWTEWDRDDPACPTRLKGYGSPTILVDGEDVTGAAPAGDGACCRSYIDEGGRVAGAPPLGLILTALKK